MMKLSCVESNSSGKELGRFSVGIFVSWEFVFQVSRGQRDQREKKRNRKGSLAQRTNKRRERKKQKGERERLKLI